MFWVEDGGRYLLWFADNPGRSPQDMGVHEPGGERRRALRLTCADCEAGDCIGSAPSSSMEPCPLLRGDRGGLVPPF